MSSKLLIEMKSIHKVYPDGTVALRGVDFEVSGGEIIGLLGENGAGKTTLMKILSGLLPPTSGEIYYNGKKVHFRNPSDALKLGIGMVHQYFALVPPFTPMENIILGQEKTGWLFPLDLKGTKEKIKALMEETSLYVPLDTPVEMLSAGVQQRVEILKVLYRGTDVLILDEPTSYLTPLEVEELFKVMRKLKAQGKAIVFITHKLREVMEISDRIQVLRNGVVTGRLPTSEATFEKLAIMMVGKEVIPQAVRSQAEPGEPILKVNDLHVMSDFGTMAVKGISFEVRAGEIFGIAGVEGNGQSELIQAITGIRRPVKGEIWIKGHNVTAFGPLKLYSLGLSHIPEDKSKFGLAMNFDLAENSILSRQWESQFAGTLGRLNWDRILKFAEHLVKSFNVIAPGLRTPVKSLSGGNQQRLLVGRELSKEPFLVVAAHPTRGLDIASTVYIRELLIKMRDAGKAVLLVSADLDEILELSDRIAVMYEGEFLGEGRIGEFAREEIGMMMGGVRLKTEPGGKR